MIKRDMRSNRMNEVKKEGEKDEWEKGLQGRKHNKAKQG